MGDHGDPEKGCPGKVHWEVDQWKWPKEGDGQRRVAQGRRLKDGGHGEVVQGRRWPGG